MELSASSGVDSKTAKALGEFVEKAMKSFGSAARSRQHEAMQRPASTAFVVLIIIVAAAVVVTVQLGTIYWLNDSIRSEISELRSDMREGFRSVEAKIDVLLFEGGALHERVTGIEAVVEDRLPAVQ